MIAISEQAAGGKNMLAYLGMLKWSELGDSILARSDSGYNVIVTGIDGKLELFDDYSVHPFSKGRPSKKINNKGLISSASGAYQFMLKDYVHYRDQLKLPDFGPLSQDRWAIQLIKERRAIDDIKAGRIESAIGKCKNIWASLTGAGYGQREHSMSTLIAKYVELGGTLA